MIRLSPIKVIAPLVGLLMCLAGCVHAPDTRAGQQSLVDRADLVLDEMVQHDARMQRILDDAYAYAVFPDVGQGGFIVAGGSGTGVVYEEGSPVGFAELRQGSIGAQVGGQTFSELILFENREAFERFKRGAVHGTASASTTVVQSGVADVAVFRGGVATYIFDERGFMAQAAFGGQRVNYIEGPMT